MICRRCPNDRTVIAQVAQHRHWPQPLVRFYWCPYCEELFAFVGENELGGRFAVSFVPDQEATGWQAGRVVGSERDAQAAIAAVRHIAARRRGPGAQDTR